MNLKSGNINVKHQDLLWMLATWMFWTCLIMWNVRLGAREPGEASQLILTSWHSVLIFQLAASFYIQLLGLLKRKSIGKLFKVLHEFDVMVKVFGKS